MHLAYLVASGSMQLISAVVHMYNRSPIQSLKWCIPHEIWNLGTFLMSLIYTSLDVRGICTYSLINVANLMLRPLRSHLLGTNLDLKDTDCGISVSAPFTCLGM